jgi:hypothetical protein
MNRYQANSIPTRLQAMKPGESLCLEGVTINAARIAASRVAGRTGIPYRARLEGTDRHSDKPRVVVYCGESPERIVTTKHGVQRFAGRHKLNSVMSRAGVPDKGERWYGFPMEELKEQVARGWRLFCAERRLDPRWA